jgi:hypothetical protein
LYNASAFQRLTASSASDSDWMNGVTGTKLTVVEDKILQTPGYGDKLHQQHSDMGVTKKGFASIHTLIQGDLSKWSVDHTQQGDNQFWRLYYGLNPGYERKVDEIEVGRIPNVTSSIRLTREKHPPFQDKSDN